jgi:outer membrane protein assembly factor BamB
MPDVQSAGASGFRRTTFRQPPHSSGRLMPRTKAAPLIIGINGHIIAINAATGEELWRTKLRAASLITIHHTDGKIFAGASGELFCLDGKSGAILWHNKLKGLGHGFVSFGVQDAASSAAILAAQAAATAAAVVAATA